MTEAERDLLQKAADALTACAKAALTVKPELDTPYPDRPEWTPYTRWVERPTSEAVELVALIRKHLHSAGKRQEWWITTDALSRGGEKVLGPFGSQELAIEVRRYVETAEAPRTFWVQRDDSTGETEARLPDVPC